MKKGIVVLLSVVTAAVLLSGCDQKPHEMSIADETSVTASSTSEAPQSTTPATSITTTAAPESTDSPVIGDSSDFIDVNENRRQIVITAQALEGIPYNFGCASPTEGFDNSGLIYYVLRENGYINCPRATIAQSVMGTKITMKESLPGDLMFFSEDGTEDTIFGGIYLGDGKLIYSPYPGETVKVADINGSYWQRTFQWAVKIS